MIAQVTRTGMSPGRGQSLGLWNFSFVWRRRHTSRELADSGDRGLLGGVEGPAWGTRSTAERGLGRRWGLLCQASCCEAEAGILRRLD